MSNPSRFERVQPLLVGAVCLALLGTVAAFLADPTPGPRQGKAPAGLRDWQKHPAVVEVDTTHDIYAVGDPHGDYDRLVTVLARAKVIRGDPGPPEKVQWMG